MEENKKNLFFSKGEGLAFWIAGYCDNSYVVDDIVKMLSEKAAEFRIIANVSNIKTMAIPVSSRYKNMRVFFAHTNECPLDAFVIDNNDFMRWTMDRWLTN